MALLVFWPLRVRLCQPCCWLLCAVQERNRIAGSSEAQVQLRMKRSAIADLEAKLMSLLSRRRRELLQLLGTGVGCVFVFAHLHLQVCGV